MEKNSKKKKVLLTLLGITSLIVITMGISYAFFSYTKKGTTDNAIQTGSITFLYTEVSGVGKGIALTDAYPMDDDTGKHQSGEGKVFDFKITSSISMKTSIVYEITARKKTDSTLDDSQVKVYLTETDGTEKEILLNKFSELPQTTRTNLYTEKTLYTGIVPANTTNYEKNFRLRMWIADDTDFSDGSMNDKTFTLTVNAYSDDRTDANQKPTAPNLTGGSSDWVSAAPTIKVLNEGTAVSGVKEYEYYTSTSNIQPTDETEPTGTTNGDLTITDEGTTYIWYRTVSNAGLKSDWSDFQVVNFKTSITVTYVVNGIKYTESVNGGQSVLSPTSFTLSKSDTTFVGWSDDSSSTNILTSKVAEGNDITLYAVWKYNDKTMRSFSANQTIGAYPSFPNVEYADSSKYEAIRIETSGCYLVFSLYNEANTYGTSMQLIVGNKTFYNRWLVGSGTYNSDYITSGTYPGTTLSIYSDYATKYFTSSISFIAVGKKIVG